MNANIQYLVMKPENSIVAGYKATKNLINFVIDTSFLLVKCQDQASDRLHLNKI